jgi:antagonist of KipI
MDSFAFRVANLLAGNPENAAALEITLTGPDLEFSQDTRLAVCGAEFSGVRSWRPLVARAGERLVLGECVKGCRAYLAVAGGISVEPVLGSRSTYLRGGFGGFKGRALRDGDKLETGANPAGPPPSGPAALFFVSPFFLPPYSASPTVRVVAGAQAGEFARGLFAGDFEVTARSDRMGLRLGGRQVARQSGVELRSAPAVPGSIQVPPDGHPIVLMVDAQSIGGYPLAAHVISVDLPLVAQLRPRDTLRFSEVPLAEAQRLLVEREREMALLREGIRQHLRRHAGA